MDLEKIAEFKRIFEEAQILSNDLNASVERALSDLEGATKAAHTAKQALWEARQRVMTYVLEELDLTSVGSGV